jgi:hypothetical protein
MNTHSEAHRINFQALLTLQAFILTTYVVSVITRLIRICNFFKISCKLHSVGSFLNYHEGTASFKTIIAIHSIFIVSYLGRSVFEWVIHNYPLNVLPFIISSMMCQIITNFAEIQFLYFVYIVRRHFMLLNSRLNEMVVSLSTVKSKEKLPFNRNNISEFSSVNNLVNCGLRDVLNLHMTLCDVLDSINSTYSLQVLALTGWKFLGVTVAFYLIVSVILDSTIKQVHSFPSLIAVISSEVTQLVTVVHCCKYAGFQVRVISEYYEIYMPRLGRFRVLTAATVKMTVVWDAAPCSLAEIRGVFWLHHHRTDDGSSEHL